MSRIDFDDFGGDLDDLEDIGDSGGEAIARFEALVDQKMRLLLTRKADANQRRDAALWLGESGAPKAITALRKIHRGEKDKRIRDAAEYALGMFKALDLAIEREPGEQVTEALQRDENKAIYEMLLNIALKGDMGRRKRIPTSALIRIQMFLVALLIVLGVLNALVLMSDSDTPGTTQLRALGQANTGSPALDALADLRIVLGDVRADAQTLQRQLNAINAGETPDCAVTFINRPLYRVSPSVQTDYPNIGILANRLGATSNNVATALTAFTEACVSGQPLATDYVSETLATLQTIIDEDLPSIAEAISAAEAAVPPVTTDTPDTEEIIVETEAPTPEPEPTPEPTTSIDRATLNLHLRELYAIINTATEGRGALTLLGQYWADAARAGTTDACRLTAPNIPQPYAVPEEVMQLVPQLRTVSEEINDIGLTLLRQGWTLFTTSCTNGTLSQNAATGQIIVQNVTDAFNSARQTLDTLR